MQYPHSAVPPMICPPGMFDVHAVRSALNGAAPPAHSIYAWSNALRLEDVKVVILGLEPSCTGGNAHGMCSPVCL